MAKVTVSANRVSSMLANRNRSLVDLEEHVVLSTDPLVLVSRDTEVAFGDLLALAKYFKRPWSYFLVDEEEAFKSAGMDNRSKGNLRRPLSPELLDEVAAVADMLAAAADLFPETRYEVPPRPITIETPPEVAGAAIREFLGISWEAQTRARSDFEALRLWGDALQSRGVYVSQRSLRDETIRAFSRVEGEQAVLVVDTGDTAYARIFSLVHEYCHVVLRSTGICDLSDHSQVERHCNAVAGAALLPEELIAAASQRRPFTGVRDADDRVLKDMSRDFRVSQAMLLIRLRELGLIDEITFDALEARRASRRADIVKTSGGTYYPPRINRVGRRYARNVIGALDRGLINRQDASGLLEIGEHLIPAYRQELDGTAKSPR
jgi:Zn-dependent peptidase ImmA (M78 family)